MPSWPRDIATYVGRMRQFDRQDALVYGAWVGLMLALLAAVGGFVLLGHGAGVRFTADAYTVPAGIAIFAAAIAVDTIGHRTIYRDVLAQGEALVHHVTIFFGVTSCIALCLGFSYPQGALVPAAVLTALTFLYSLVDEAMHWRRYLHAKSDRVEMWSHVFIFVGHGVMMLGWWRWYLAGYPGVAETLRALAGP